MVYRCYLCKWPSEKEPRRSFHQFPSDPNKRQRWLQAIGKGDAVIGKRTSICSLHFEKSCIRYGFGCGKELLKAGSLPSIYLTTNEGLLLPEETNDDLLTTIESEFCDNSERLILPSIEKNTENKVAIERSAEPIEDGEIPEQKIYLASSTEEHSIDSNELYNVKNQLNEKSIEISSLRRQVRRLQLNNLNLKVFNNNLRCKVKRLEKEVKIVSRYVSAKKNIEESEFSE